MSYSNIEIIKGDITLAGEDVIVNAANQKMLGGGGVDGAIHRAAGPELLDECKAVRMINGVRCPVGRARITGSGKLKSKYVIHTVGPRYEEDPEPEKLLFKAYTNSLILAEKYNCNSIAFPAISCGVFGYPFREAAEIAREACTQKDFEDMEIYFYLYGMDIYHIWQDTFR